jgi:hypothetical protein
MTSGVEGWPSGPFGRDRHFRARGLALVLVFLGAALAPQRGAAQGAASPPETTRHVWLDVEGEPLPFQSDAEILEVLRSAPVVSRQTIPVGVNKPQELVLEKDGTRLRAAFRVVDKKQKNVRIGERYYFDFRDSYRHEPAAYELARWLGLDSVPPAVLRTLDGKDGSVQIWVENARNTDRNSGNVLVGQDYRLWLIDHTRAFQPERQLLNPETLARIKRSVWNRLVAMSEDDLVGLLGDFLDHAQVSALAKRRDLLIEHVEGLVAERGEGAVFY